MTVSLIVAVARNGIIGRAGALPWRLPEDLAHFKRTTLGHPVVMGRKTWDSICRPLPGRRNLVVTRDAAWRAVGAEAAPSVDAAIARCDPDETVFVIGGAAIYRAALPLADTLVVTEIDRDFDGDTALPPIDAAAWIETARERYVGGGAEALPYAIVHYARRPAAG